VNTHAPPVKPKRGSRLMPATPSYFGPTDDTPLICSAQEECSHEETRIEILPPGSVHFGKEICRNCDRLLRWLPKPSTLEHRRFNALRIARLTMCNGLTSWQRKFVSDIAPLRKLSPRQQEILDELVEKFLERKMQ
jgi:hypothetical protein